MNPLSDTFDDFVDDLLSSDINLLKGELDFLENQLIMTKNLNNKYKQKE